MTNLYSDSALMKKCNEEKIFIHYIEKNHSLSITRVRIINI